MSKSKAVANKKQTIKDLLLSDEAKAQFAKALPRHLSPDRFIRIALTALNKTPRLAECTQASLFSCLLDLSQLGIEPDGRKAHLIPYKKAGTTICTLIIDYKGLVELARRSGNISDIHADVVYEKDKFSFSYGSQGHLTHSPALADRGEPRASYSYVKLKDGSESFEVMNLEEINGIRERSKAKDEGPWQTDWAEMAKKTVFRRHSKWLPMSPEFMAAVEKDYDTPIDITPDKIETAEHSKPMVEMPEAIDEPADEPQSAYEKMLGELQVAKKQVGDKVYYGILDDFGYKHANEIKSVKKMKEVLQVLIPDENYNAGDSDADTDGRTKEKV